MLDIKAIKARCEAATPGPWEARQVHDEDQDPLSQSIADGCWYVETPGGISICDLIDDPEEANAAFIGAAREDVPALIAEVESLREDLATLQGAIDSAAEALIGEGYEFDPTSVADELFAHVSEHLRHDLRVSTKSQ